MNSKDLKNKLVTQVVDSNGEVIYDFTDVIDAIKNKIDTLEKENQELKDEMGMYIDTNNKFYEENTKLKKALEIFKNKRVDIPKLLTTTFIVYNELALLIGYDKLTQEEWELLKGVLE